MKNDPLGGRGKVALNRKKDTYCVFIGEEKVVYGCKDMCAIEEQ